MYRLFSDILEKFKTKKLAQVLLAHYKKEKKPKNESCLDIGPQKVKFKIVWGKFSHRAELLDVKASLKCIRPHPDSI